MQITVVVSGMHSGPNPSPGLGIARSLKLADADVRVVGLDYSAASSGLHTSVLDEVVLLPGWDEIHLETWADQVAELIAAPDTFLIPTFDLEVRLLAQYFGVYERILAPNKRVLDTVTKPPESVAEALGVRLPESSADTDWDAVERFIRHTPHGAWVKGQHYEAFRVRSVEQALAAGRFVEREWGGDWHLEAHVPGQECGIAFVARSGVLLDAVLMTKAILTPEGKTWSGEIAELPEQLWEKLRVYTADVGWNGGGEIETIRTWEGDMVLMEVNPRFPAWIHGATTCGANLPAALVTERARPGDRRLTPGFTRIVEEISVAPELGISPYPWGPSDGINPATKHPSGMRGLGRRGLLSEPPALRGPASATPSHRPRQPQPLEGALSLTSYEAVLEVPSEDRATPSRQILTPLFDERVAALRARFADLPHTVLAHSIKTCPDPELLSRAAGLGLVAEAITLDELEVAVGHGFDPGRALLNGPAKWWPARAEVHCGAFFADSVEELAHLLRALDAGFRLTADVVGVRVSAPGVPSRFGISFDNSADLAQTAALVGELRGRLGARWGIHFHQAESVLGPHRWRHEAAAALASAGPLADRLGDPPAVVDLGGGWHVDDLPILRSSVDHVLAAVPDRLRAPETELVLEPGKILTQPAAAVVTRILLAKGRGSEREVIVDAALGDIPEARYRAHPVARFTNQEWRPVARGTGRVLGRSCMENDILAEEVDVSSLAEGDFLAFGMCGAYDLSMAYPFGRGRATASLS
ncbi:hypothetical protein [Streptomyces zaomyceticus]|uniref:hypothetical protein n=1 Tax=Streptomyces zaomyceticus TaxID=68286 RepID=UPI002E136E2E|nr:hypothetical protein OG237_42810 [Streptomyces zaomyceticus]